LKSNGGSDET